MSIDSDLILRETLPLRTAGEIRGSYAFDSRYLVVEVIGGASAILPYPGIVMTQVFLGTDPEISGTELILRQGKQLVTLLSAGDYFLKFRAERAIARASIKVWEYVGFFDDGGGNGANLTPELIRNLLIELEGNDRLDYSALKNSPTIQDIKAGIESLEGNDRLDYSALKNKPVPPGEIIVELSLNLSPGLSGIVAANFPKAGMLTKLQSNAPSRIRGYLSESYAAADQSRAPGTQIQGDHGCFFDLQTKTERGLIRNTAPPPLFYSDGQAFLSISNLSTTENLINLTLTILEIQR